MKVTLQSQRGFMMLVHILTVNDYLCMGYHVHQSLAGCHAEPSPVGTPSVHPSISPLCGERPFEHLQIPYLQQTRWRHYTYLGCKTWTVRTGPHMCKEVTKRGALRVAPYLGKKQNMRAYMHCTQALACRP